MIRYYIRKDKLHNKLLWGCGFSGEEIEVSRGQYWFLIIFGFIGYRMKDNEYL